MSILKSNWDNINDDHGLMGDCSIHYTALRLYIPSLYNLYIINTLYNFIFRCFYNAFSNTTIIIVLKSLLLQIQILRSIDIIFTLDKCSILVCLCISRHYRNVCVSVNFQ